MHASGIPNERHSDVLELFCGTLSSVYPGDVNPITLRLPSGDSPDIIQALFNVGRYTEVSGGDPRIRDILCRYWSRISEWITLSLQHAFDNTNVEHVEEFRRRKSICWSIFEGVTKNEIVEIEARIEADENVYSIYLAISEERDRRIAHLAQLGQLILFIQFRFILLAQSIQHVLHG